MKIKKIKYVDSNKSRSVDEVKKIEILIGEDKFTVSESIDGKLNINKVGGFMSDTMILYPRYTDEIELS